MVFVIIFKKINWRKLIQTLSIAPDSIPGPRGERKIVKHFQRKAIAKVKKTGAPFYSGILTLVSVWIKKQVSSSASKLYIQGWGIRWKQIRVYITTYLEFLEGVGILGDRLIHTEKMQHCPQQQENRTPWVKRKKDRKRIRMQEI